MLLSWNNRLTKFVSILNGFIRKVAITYGGLTMRNTFLCVFGTVLTSMEIKLIGRLLYGIVCRLPFFMCLKSLLVSVFQRQTGEGTSQFCGGALHRNAILVQIMQMEYMCQRYRRILEQVSGETVVV